MFPDVHWGCEPVGHHEWSGGPNDVWEVIHKTNPLYFANLTLIGSFYTSMARNTVLDLYVSIDFHSMVSGNFKWFGIGTYGLYSW